MSNGLVVYGHEEQLHLFHQIGLFTDRGSIKKLTVCNIRAMDEDCKAASLNNN